MSRVRIDIMHVYFWSACISIVILLIISGLSALPLNNNVPEQKLTDENSDKIVSVNSSSSILNSGNVHIEVKQKETFASSTDTGNTNNSMKAMLTTTTLPWYSTTPRRLGDSDSLPWYGYVLIILAVLCCCCLGGSGASKAKTGRWVPARVWVENWI